MINRTMKTAYFPYTCLSHRTFIALKTLFGAVTLYPPLADSVPESMKRWEAEHQLVLRFPASGNESELHRALKAFRQWAENHALSQREFLRFQDTQASLSNDAHTYRIRDEIRHRIRGAKQAPATDPLLTARLFLVLAQEYDRQHMEIAKEWGQLEKMEYSLYDTLRGEGLAAAEEEDRVPADIGAPTSDLMIQRLRAWARLMLEDESPPVIFATTSREAFELIVDDTPSADPLPGFNAASFPLPPDRDAPEASRQLMVYLERVAVSEWSVENAERFDVSTDQRLSCVRLTVAIVPDTPAGAVFSRYSGYASFLPEKRGAFRHTLLALVER